MDRERRGAITGESSPADASMASNFEGPEVLEAAVAGIPAIAEFVAAVPSGQRAIALDALEGHYLQMAEDWGCSEGPTRMWVSAMMSHLRERIEQMTEPGINGLAGDRPNEDYSLAEKILTRITGALALLVLSPLIAFVWAGLKFERRGPVISMRTTGQGSAYQFVLGSGWVSRVVRRADLEAIPMMWHLLNGDNVLRFNDFAEIVRPTRPTASSKKGRKPVEGDKEMLPADSGQEGEGSGGKQTCCSAKHSAKDGWLRPPTEAAPKRLTYTLPH